jgi:hypothetical protein
MLKTQGFRYYLVRVNKKTNFPFPNDFRHDSLTFQWLEGV